MNGRPVFVPHAPYLPRAATPAAQGVRAYQRVPLWRLDGTPAEGGSGVTLDGDVFDVPIRVDIVHRVVRWQLAKKQAGTHSTKDRSEVSGTGKKPHPQKGTGRARAGTKRAPHHRGGGVAHGPRPRSHAHKLQRKVRRLGLCCALSAKLAEGNLVIVDSAAPSAPKTAALLAQLQALCVARGEPVTDEPSFLIIDAVEDAEAQDGVLLRRTAANLPRVHIMPSVGAHSCSIALPWPVLAYLTAIPGYAGLNVYSILQKRTLVMTAKAAAEVTERLTRPIKR